MREMSCILKIPNQTIFPRRIQHQVSTTVLISHIKKYCEHIVELLISLSGYLSAVSSVLRVHSIINLIYLLKNSHSHCLQESSMISYLKLNVVMGQPLTWTKLFANLWLPLIPLEIRRQ